MTKKIQSKTVGVLGGMGPFATLVYLRNIYLLTPAKKDWEHLHIIIDNNVKIPSRTRAVLYHEISPVKMMVDSINRLTDMGVDFVTVPCNSAHYFYQEVASKIKIPWLDMIKTTGNKYKNYKPLVLGGYIITNKKLYSKYIPHAQYLTDKSNKVVYQAIEEIKLTDKLSSINKEKLQKVISLISGDIDSILLACTELGIVKKELLKFGKIIDSAEEYAKATINYANSKK